MTNGKIANYGISAWRAFRTPSDERVYINLENLDKIVRQSFGEKHGFKFLFSPINLAMPESYIEKYQFYNGGLINRKLFFTENRWNAWL
jgi:hypothetical protein